MKIHHTAICTRDIEASMRFWQDGLGFVQQIDEVLMAIGRPSSARVSRGYVRFFWAIPAPRTPE